MPVYGEVKFDDATYVHLDLLSYVCAAMNLLTRRYIRLMRSRLLISSAKLLRPDILIPMVVVIHCAQDLTVIVWICGQERKWRLRDQSLTHLISS